MIFRDSTKRNKELEFLCEMTQEELKTFLHTQLGSECINEKGFLYRKGTFPVLLCAHMDTVHKYAPEMFVYVNGTLCSPDGIGGDDRCGVYIILHILQKYNCSVLFLEDEEIGCIGAKAFAASDYAKEITDLKYMIEFDRRGYKDAVTYSCDNKEFDAFITEEWFEKANGTCSDISYLMPALGIAGVNLSSGYYGEHSLDEYIVLDDVENTIDEACKILARTKEMYKYTKSTSSYTSYYDRTYYGYSGSYSVVQFEITYKNEEGVEYTESIDAYTEDVAIGKFMRSHPYVSYIDITDIKKTGGYWNEY